jgi:ketosteroid isomerase-like protein
LSITSGDDVAFCHSLNRIHGTRTDGERTDVWVRATVGFRKMDGMWTITHEHYSVPFYMEPPLKSVDRPQALAEKICADDLDQEKYSP